MGWQYWVLLAIACGIAHWFHFCTYRISRDAMGRQRKLIDELAETRDRLMMERDEARRELAELKRTEVG